MKVELHILQNFAPACLNRDDTNAPKDCEFGGYRRARISSQCIKRAIRGHFLKSALGQENLAIRTRLLVSKGLVPRLSEAGKDPDETRAVAEFVLKGLGLGVNDDDETEYLLFLGDQEIKGLVDLFQQHWETLKAAAGVQTTGQEDQSEETATTRKRAKKAGRKALPSDLRKEFLSVLNGGQAVDLALFGRMVADLPDRNIDAACQVAHAISTHAVSREMDFFTAVDDLQPEAETGAGMMGIVEFNSACFYRYSLLDLGQLVTNLGDDAELAYRALQALLKASIDAIPTGKQNTFAAHNPPSFVFAVVRDGGVPCSLANAFVNPVRPSAKNDLVASSIQQLDAYWSRMVAGYGTTGIKGSFACVCHDTELDHLKSHQVDSIEAVITGVGEAIR